MLAFPLALPLRSAHPAAGVDDLVITACGVGTADCGNTGAAYVVFGRATGTR